MSTPDRAPRIGCVPYLNALPLRHGLAATLATPSALAARFAAGDFDTALLPVFEILQLPTPIVAEGFGICADGPVRSVFVAHRRPLTEEPEIVLDPASRTSSNLLRVLLANVIGGGPRCVEASANPLAARLLIGDPALAFRKSAPDGWQLTDLADVWKEWTGLPFVFALWAFPDDSPAARRLADKLRAAARNGLNARADLVRTADDPAVALDYLTRAIVHEIPPTGPEAIARFRDELSTLGLLRDDTEGLVWI